jgi:DNA transformation protein and related proteins
MRKRVSQLSETRNFGKTSGAWLNSIGVYSIEDLRRMGSIRAFVLLKEHGFNVSMNMLYAMEGALLGIHWKKLPGGIKAELREAVKGGKKT